MQAELEELEGIVQVRPKRSNPVRQNFYRRLTTTMTTKSPAKEIRATAETKAKKVRQPAV